MKRMLFNATQAEELRVAIVDGQKLIDLDIESAAKEQRKGNIYKAVITRIEPSLEAAFVDYGSERHGFLPFKEVARSYFQPGADTRNPRIQDALKVGQQFIVQVEKDERGNKGAALTTYVSLAGRYLVLMPNNPRGGGVSRRIEGEERQELREAMDQLEIPAGMSLIARTAGIGRTPEELNWDLSYLLQLWTAIDDASKADGSFLIYQESSLVIRAIRDYFQPEIGEILIDTDDIYEQARQFMSHVMPGNVACVKRYRDDVPLFSRFQIEHQIESAFARQVTLPSGGAVVIDHTEALVSIDVNSGRSTKGADIEETALRTNVEAADEIARQLRLRDLGGLIVIDFIDMESSKGQREVENRLREALHFDRARVQTGKISRFGLLELSRQRLRPALAETSYITCPRCTGTGHIRSTESAALHVLRILEEEAMKENTAAIHVQAPVDVSTFLLNEKRVDIARIEMRHHVDLLIIPNRHFETPQQVITRLRHDQLNQEGDIIASYVMPMQPGDEEAELPQADSKTPVRAQAAVKGVTPAQPAPLSPPAPVKEAPGLLARLFAWLGGGGGEEKTPKAAPSANSTRRSRNDKSERNDRSRRDGRDANRERNGKKNEARDGKDADNRQQNRKDRGERGGKNNRSRKDRGEDKAAKNVEEKSAATTANASKETAAATPGGDQESGREATTGGENNRRRGRRGGRGRGERKNDNNRGDNRDDDNGNGTASADNAAATEAVAAIESGTPPEQANADLAPDMSVAQQTTSTVAAASLQPTTTVTDDEKGPGERPLKAAPWPTPQPLPPQDVAAEKSADGESNDAAATPPVAAPAPVVTPAPAAPADACGENASSTPPLVAASQETAELPADEAATTTPVPTSAAVPDAAATPPPQAPVVVSVAAPEASTTASQQITAPSDPIDLKATLGEAGLQLVETSSATAQPKPEPTPKPQLGRKPKPTPIISDEPLQMVETRNGD